MRVGFIGLGRMGRPMCRRLIDAGHEVVVHNRTRALGAGLAEADLVAVLRPYEDDGGTVVGP